MILLILKRKANKVIFQLTINNDKDILYNANEIIYSNNYENKILKRNGVVIERIRL